MYPSPPRGAPCSKVVLTFSFTLLDSAARFLLTLTSAVFSPLTMPPCDLPSFTILRALSLYVGFLYLHLMSRFHDSRFGGLSRYAAPFVSLSHASRSLIARVFSVLSVRRHRCDRMLSISFLLFRPWRLES